MPTQQQDQQHDLPQKHWSKSITWTRLLIASVILLFVAIGIIIWMLTSGSAFTAILPIVIFTVLGILIALFQWLFPISSSTSEQPSAHQHTSVMHQVQPIIVPVHTIQPLPLSSPPTEKASYRGIVGLPPPTDPRTIQQREQVVREVYSKLIQPDITAIVLSGIGGVGKSTLAALIYRYVEEQRHVHTSPFLAEPLWLTVDPATTFADLAGNLFEALGKPLLNLSNLASQNQAVALFNALNATEKPRLVIIDQFENLLDWDTGHALTNRPGVGEWLDIINSHPCACRILLTSRPRPIGTREYPPTYLQEYRVAGLELSEGVALLRKQGVQGTEAELQVAVAHCAGHAFSLTLLASLLRDHQMDLETLFRNSALWTGDIATNLLDQIYAHRLTEVQRELLLAFSIYREPVPLDASLAIIAKRLKANVQIALKTLLTEHLLEAVGDSRYQPHAIIAAYAKSQFDGSNENTSVEFLQAAHARAAQYYLERAARFCPPLEQRHKISDVHDLIETIWQLCQAGKWQEAYDLMEKEAFFVDLYFWGNDSILLELYQLLLTNRWLSKPPEKAHIYTNLAEVYNHLGRLDQAQKYFEKALMLWKELGDRERECVVLNLLGAVYRQLGQKELGQKCTEDSLGISRELGNQKEESRAITNLAMILSDSYGQKTDAQVYCERALEISRQLGDLRLESWILTILGSFYADLGQKERGRDYLKQALQIRKGLGNRPGEGGTLTILGRVFMMMDQSEQALKCTEEALSISREIGNYLGEGKAHNNLGLIYASLEKRKLALDQYEQALFIFRRVGERRKEGKVLNNLGQVYFQLEQNEKALECYCESWRILRGIGDRWWESVTVYNVGILHFKEMHYDVALACFLLAKRAFDELHHPLREETRNWIEKIHKSIGDEQFTPLLAAIEPQAQQIVVEALGGTKSISGELPL